MPIMRMAERIYKSIPFSSLSFSLFLVLFISFFSPLLLFFTSVSFSLLSLVCLCLMLACVLVMMIMMREWRGREDRKGKKGKREILGKVKIFFWIDIGNSSLFTVYTFSFFLSFFPFLLLSLCFKCVCLFNKFLLFYILLL